MQIVYHSMLKFSRACYRIDQDGVNKRAKLWSAVCVP